MVTGGFTSTENTDSTEILNSRTSSWTQVGALPYARNELRATTVANNIYLFVGAETDVLKFEASSQSWVHYADMTPKEGSKLEVSPINCSLIQTYLNKTTATPTAITPTPTTTTPKLSPTVPTETLPPVTTGTTPGDSCSNNFYEYQAFEMSPSTFMNFSRKYKSPEECLNKCKVSMNSYIYPFLYLSFP